MAAAMAAAVMVVNVTLGDLATPKMETLVVRLDVITNQGEMVVAVSNS